jgi:hypothetical protein
VCALDTSCVVRSMGATCSCGAAAVQGATGNGRQGGASRTVHPVTRASPHVDTETVHILETPRRGSSDEKATPAPPEVAAIEYTPACTVEKSKFPYGCPLCFRHLESVLVTSCCKQYVCHECALAWWRTKPEGREATKVPTQLIRCSCPNCGGERGFVFAAVDPRARIRSFLDSPATLQALASNGGGAAASGGRDLLPEEDDAPTGVVEEDAFPPSERGLTPVGTTAHPITQLGDEASAADEQSSFRERMGSLSSREMPLSSRASNHPISLLGSESSGNASASTPASPGRTLRPTGNRPVSAHGGVSNAHRRRHSARVAPKQFPAAAVAPKHGGLSASLPRPRPLDEGVMGI